MSSVILLARDAFHRAMFMLECRWRMERILRDQQTHAFVKLKPGVTKQPGEVVYGDECDKWDEVKPWTENGGALE